MTNFKQNLPIRHDIRASAKGEHCTMRIPGVCNGDTSTTVYCHIRKFGFGGMGKKPIEPLGYYGCSACHAYQEAGNAGCNDLLFALSGTLVRLREKGLLGE